MNATILNGALAGDGFVDAVAAALDLALLEPTYAWLPGLPAGFRLREIELSTLGAARRLAGPVFVKPVDDKFFWMISRRRMSSGCTTA